MATVSVSRAAPRNCCVSDPICSKTRWVRHHQMHLRYKRSKFRLDKKSLSNNENVKTRVMVVRFCCGHGGFGGMHALAAAPILWCDL